MALVERLMHDSSEPLGRHIGVHYFFSACQEIISGRLTSAQVQTFLNMTPADIADWNAIVGTIPAQNQAASRALWVSGVHAVFMLAEGRFPGYDSPAAIRSKLGI